MDFLKGMPEEPLNSLWELSLTFLHSRKAKLSRYE
jgi:hypothetical protein